MPSIYPGEKGFKIKITITDETGAVVNLTGASAEFVILQPNGQSITKTAVVDNGSAGICSFTTSGTSDFSATGTYKVQPRVTLSTGDIFYGTSQDMVVKPLGE